LRGAATPHRDRTPQRRADGDGFAQRVPRARHHHAEGLDLVDTGVGGVERPRDGIEADLAIHPGLQLAPQRRGAQAHSDSRPARSSSRPRVSVWPPLAKETRSVPSPPGPYAAPWTTATPLSV